jgi:hypothetical protein
MKIKKILLVAGLGVVSPFFVSASTDHLIISQIQVEGIEKTTDDFIEIYNPTQNDVNLKGLKLVKRTKTGTTDTSLVSWDSDTAAPIMVVKAHGFYLWANSSYNSIFIDPDVTRSGSIAKDNGVALKNKTGDLIDSVSWGEAANGFSGSAYPNNPEKGQSLERNLSSLNFFLQTSPHPRNSSSSASAPDSEESAAEEDITASEPVHQYPQGVVISELMVNPEGADSGEESPVPQLVLSCWNCQFLLI